VTTIGEAPFATALTALVEKGFDDLVREVMAFAVAGKTPAWETILKRIMLGARTHFVVTSHYRKYMPARVNCRGVENR